MADHWAHWLEVGAGIEDAKRPRIFQVNWFRKDEDGRFLWPGFGENSRVIEWIVGQVEAGRGLRPDDAAVASPVGLLPAPGALDLDGIDVPEADLTALFDVPTEPWLAEAELTEQFFGQFGDRTPAALRAQLAALRERLGH
jgi:phosphoenolpyruvate carboxykinase (GTP)